MITHALLALALASSSVPSAVAAGRSHRVPGDPMVGAISPVVSITACGEKTGDTDLFLVVEPA